MYIEVGQQLLNGQNDYISLLALWNEYKKMTGKILITKSILCFFLSFKSC